MKKNEFRISEVPPGSVRLMGDVAVFSVEGGFCATQARCTHMQGPLNEGTFDGSTVTCALPGSQFNVRAGAVLRRPGEGSPQDLPRDGRRRSWARRRFARTYCPKRVTCD